MKNDRRNLGIGHRENSFLHSSFQNSLYQFRLTDIEVFPDLLHPPNVTKKISFQCPVTEHQRLDCIQSCIKKCHQLFVRRQVFRCYILQHLVQLVQLGLDYCQINLVFTFKVCVKRPPSLFGCLCNIVHCRIIHPHAGKQLSGHIHQHLTCLRNCHRHLYCTF